MKSKVKDPYAPSRTETAFWAGVIVGGVLMFGIIGLLVVLVGG